MSSNNQKSVLASILDLIKLLIMLPVCYRIIMDALSDINKITVTATDINEIMRQELTSIANVIIIMALKMFLVFAVLETISIIILVSVKKLKKS